MTDRKISVEEMFGENVFTVSKMKERLPKSVYRDVLEVMRGGGELSRADADVVAKAMKDWAMENGATHYTHWFQPLTGITAEKHDAMIAFTSEMPHIISNAFIKSPTAKEHDGFSAGSYKDLTRVAWLNETMWTEIFLENRDNIIKELDYIQKNLAEYKAALEKNDAEELWKLLHDGKLAKEEVDGI